MKNSAVDSIITLERTGAAQILLYLYIHQDRYLVAVLTIGWLLSEVLHVSLEQ